MLSSTNSHTSANEQQEATRRLYPSKNSDLLRFLPVFASGGPNLSNFLLLQRSGDVYRRGDSRYI